MVTETIKSLWLINKKLKENIIPDAAETLTSLNKVLKVSFLKCYSLQTLNDNRRSLNSNISGCCSNQW